MPALFSHILDGDILTEVWCKHHSSMFENATIVLCNYQNLGTYDIISEICPHWEIYMLEQNHMNGVDVGLIGYLESKYNGWKIALNVSEFLLNDLNEYIKDLDSSINAVRTAGYILVDRNESEFGLETLNNLLITKTFGYREKGKAWAFEDDKTDDGLRKTSDFVFRSRLLHKYEHGYYKGGRHTTMASEPKVDEKLLLASVTRGLPLVHQLRSENELEAKSKYGFESYGNSGRIGIWPSFEQCKRYWNFELEKSYELTEKHPEYRKEIERLKTNVYNK